MHTMYYIGLDVHKRKISYCVKGSSGQIHTEGSISATRLDLDHWMKALPQPWTAAMEATMFTGWIYDHLKPHAAVLKVAHPLMLRSQYCYEIMWIWRGFHFAVTPFGRSRPAADASREVVERWLLDGLM
jgi:hypothetical protein